MAARNALFVDKGSDVEQGLARGYLPFDHPIERAPVEDFIHFLRQHTRRVILLGLAPVFFHLAQLEFDPVLKVLDRIRADTEFDEM